MSATENKDKTIPNNHVFRPDTGLTKREYFAAQAMLGMFANPEFVSLRRTPIEVEKAAVIAADRLIERLNEEIEK